jgi:hypothetical protein
MIPTDRSNKFAVLATDHSHGYRSEVQITRANPAPLLALGVYSMRKSIAKVDCAVIIG